MASLKLLVPGVAVLVGLNYVFTELLDESGLHVLLLTGTLETARGNATALAAFRALADFADEMSDPSESGALRFELIEQQPPPPQQQHSGYVPVISATLVHRRPLAGTPMLPQWLGMSTNDFKVRETLRLRTVWPERARWLVPSYSIEPGSLREIGRLSLLVQQRTHRVEKEAADAFRRSWTDLGYNALTEAGVLRCDLLQSDEEPTLFVARKVFRHSAALVAHEASAHYARWRDAVLPALSGTATTMLFDTIHPRTSIMPFRSRWA